MIFPDDTSRWVARDVFYWRRHNPARFQNLHEHVAPRTILDLGCHGGYTTLDLAVCYPDAKVCGVEMIDEMADVARANTDGLAKILNCAVWWQNSTVYYEPLGSSNLKRAVEYLPAGFSTEGKTVGTILDRLGWEDVDYLKMDIEGAEWEVLHDTSWHGRVRTMYVELHDHALENRVELTNFLNDNGWFATRGFESDEIFAYH